LSRDGKAQQDRYVWALQVDFCTSISGQTPPMATPGKGQILIEKNPSLKNQNLNQHEFLTT
jgi:hypothetical protein